MGFRRERVTASVLKHGSERDRLLAGMMARDARFDRLADQITAEREPGEKVVHWAPVAKASADTFHLLADTVVPCVMCLSDSRLLWVWPGQDVLSFRHAEVIGMYKNDRGWVRIRYRPADYPQQLRAHNPDGEVDAEFFFDETFEALLIGALQAYSPMYAQWRQQSPSGEAGLGG
jgi:hypothetical protein